MGQALRKIEQIEVQSPKRAIRKKVVTKVVKKKKQGLYSVPGLAVLVSVGVFGVVAGQLYLDAQINQLHYQTENLKFDIQKQVVLNEELYSKIAELSTYARAMEIANENGLSTHQNIIYIGE